MMCGLNRNAVWFTLNKKLRPSADFAILVSAATKGRVRVSDMLPNVARVLARRRRAGKKSASVAAS